MLAFLDPPEIVLILVVVLVLFGGAQLPKLAKNLGKAQKEFKDGLSEGQKADAQKAAETKAAETKAAEKTVDDSTT
jgi:sec-independent protein translocase protein TatA